MKCPECDSNKITKAGFAWKNRKKIQRYRCTNCGLIFTPKDEPPKEFAVIGVNPKDIPPEIKCKNKKGELK